MHVPTPPIFIGIAIIGLLYLIWLIMSGVGLTGIARDQDITTIRQQAGLSLLILTILSLTAVFLYSSLSKTPPTPIPA